MQNDLGLTVLCCSGREKHGHFLLASRTKKDPMGQEKEWGALAQIRGSPDSLTWGRLGHSYPLTSDPCAEGSQGQGCLHRSACAQHLFPDSGAGATANFPGCLLDPVWKFSLFSVPSSQLPDFELASILDPKNGLFLNRPGDSNEEQEL